MNNVCRLVCLAFGLVFIVPGLCHAQAKCPWLNAATAVGVLGGEVELSVSSRPEVPAAPSQYSATDQRADRFDVTCDFRRKVGDHVYQLQIAVNTLAHPSSDFPTFLARCPSNVALTAIGNEAVQCRVGAGAETSSPLTEKIIGRVRNRAFVLTLDRVPEVTVKSDENGLHEDTRNLAEQVAGSLF